MKLQSSAFEDGGVIPTKYTCDGENISPPLAIGGVPSGTASLVLIVDDPDAPGGSWVHWTVWNIPPDTTKIAEGGLPNGTIEGTTSFGTKGYGGPCPPRGTHRYIFRLYALNIPLNVPLTSDVPDIKEAMKDHMLGDAQLMGMYTKN